MKSWHIYQKNIHSIAPEISFDTNENVVIHLDKSWGLDVLVLIESVVEKKVWNCFSCDWYFLQNSMETSMKNKLFQPCTDASSNVSMTSDRKPKLKEIYVCKRFVEGIFKEVQKQLRGKKIE